MGNIYSRLGDVYGLYSYVVRELPYKLYIYWYGTPEANFTITVKTGDRFGAGTDANVEIVLFDENGKCSKSMALDNYFRDDFERGQEDTFHVTSSEMGELTVSSNIARIQLWRDNWGFGDSWFVDTIHVENTLTKRQFVFPMFRWVKANYYYHINHLDTSLPQLDDFPEQRQMLLDDRKETYQYDQKVEGGPVQVCQSCQSLLCRSDKSKSVLICLVFILYIWQTCPTNDAVDCTCMYV